jgi:hypothetical protein
LETLINQKKGVRLLRIDIDRWGSPVAKQYGINRLPTVWLYNGTTKVASDTQAAWGQVSQLN